MKGKLSLVAAALLLALFFCVQAALRAREASSAPGTGILATFGGLRSIAAEVIWFRADRLQDEGRYVELAQLASALAAMDPHTPEVWSYAAWNLAYNVSVMMQTSEDRWRWVKAGLELLRDRGLALNPRSPELYRELAWMFEIKIGADIDAAAHVYRRLWADEVSAVKATGDWKSLGMERDAMLQVERATGFDDWTDPQLSAIYWASRGLRHAKGRDRSALLEIIRQSSVIYRKNRKESQKRERVEAWSSDWVEVTAANGVKDDYYPLQTEPEKCSFRFRVMRNSDNTIGVEAFVRDDRIVADDSPAGSISCPTWKDDCLEVFFDGDNDRNPNTRGPEWNDNPTPCNAGGEYAIAANGATQSDYASAKKCFGSLWGGFAAPWERDGARIGTHYRLWFKWECLNRPAPRPDEEVALRMTVCIHDDDDGGACDYALYWKGNPKYPFADESAFGEIVLGKIPDSARAD